MLAIGHSQLQQCSVRIAVAELLVTLLLEVGFEGADGLGVVALEAVDHRCDVVGSV